MKRLLLLSTLIASVLMPVASLAAPYHNAAWFDAYVTDNGPLNITGRVLDHTINADVAKNQTVTRDGQTFLVVAAFTSNVTAVQRHCTVVQLAADADASGCSYKVDPVMYYPTISKGF